MLGGHGSNVEWRIILVVLDDVEKALVIVGGQPRVGHTVIIPVEDMITIYTSYIRSILEQSCTVWHSSLTLENTEDLERIQKSAVRVILGDQYTTYEEGLELLMLAKLSDRREKLSLSFAKKCLKNDLVSDLFPLNNPRCKEKYQVTFANTDRLKNSAVPYLQRLLNDHV